MIDDVVMSTELNSDTNVQHQARSPISDTSIPMSMDQVHTSSIPIDELVSSNGQIVRPKRTVRAPQRLVVGDPSDPRFNRARK